MATLYITEYQSLPTQSGGLAIQAGQEPKLAAQTVAIGGTHTESSAFNASTKFVRLHTDVICSVAFALSPVATASDARMAANQTEFFGVQPGDKVSVITNT